jgi:glycosyltransferase involved in cell wall biosynthesis
MLNINVFPKVSIILPTYNRAKYIVETIESVRNQTYQNWELLIIDDGSEDNTEELIIQIKDERIQLHKERRIGIAEARNEGLRKSKGELIAFIDSDDLWAQTKLEKQLIALQQYPEAGFSLTGGYNFRKLNEPLGYFYKQREGEKYSDIFIAFFKSEVAATMPSLIIRKQCLQLTGSFKENPMDFILSFARHFKAIILYEPLFYRRVHDENYSTINLVKRHYEGLEMIRSYKNSLPPRVVRDYLFRSHINFGEGCLTNKENVKAINNFYRAWKNKPFSIIPLKKTGKAILHYFKE